MAATIEQELGIKADMIKGGGGVLDIRSNGNLIFSKKAEGRWPTPEEVIEKLRGS